jgi:hypothetical protein
MESITMQTTGSGMRMASIWQLQTQAGIFTGDACTEEISHIELASFQPAAPALALPGKVDEFFPFCAREKPPVILRAFGSVYRTE